MSYFSDLRNLYPGDLVSVNYKPLTKIGYLEFSRLTGINLFEKYRVRLQPEEVQSYFREHSETAIFQVDQIETFQEGSIVLSCILKTFYVDEDGVFFPSGSERMIKLTTDGFLIRFNSDLEEEPRPGSEDVRINKLLPPMSTIVWSIYNISTQLTIGSFLKLDWISMSRYNTPVNETLYGQVKGITQDGDVLIKSYKDKWIRLTPSSDPESPINVILETYGQVRYPQIQYGVSCLNEV
jgi:hypothetical protein